MAGWDGALERKGLTELFVRTIVRGEAEAGFSLDYGIWNDCSKFGQYLLATTT